MDLENGVKLRIWGWRDYPGLSSGPSVATKVPMRGRQEGHTGDVTAEAEDVLWGWRKWPGASACGLSLKAGNGKQTVSLLEFAEGTHPFQHPEFRILASRCGRE